MMFNISIATELSTRRAAELESTMEAAKSPIKTYDRIVTGLMLTCAAGFVFGALLILGF